MERTLGARSTDLKLVDVGIVAMSVFANGGRGTSFKKMTAEGDSLVKELVAAAYSLLKATNSAVSDPSGWVAPLNGPMGMHTIFP